MNHARSLFGRTANLMFAEKNEESGLQFNNNIYNNRNPTYVVDELTVNQVPTQKVS